MKNLALRMFALKMMILVMSTTMKNCIKKEHYHGKSVEYNNFIDKRESITMKMILLKSTTMMTSIAMTTLIMHMIDY